MSDFILLPRTDGFPPEFLSDVRRITIVGANGAGKTLFMNELAKSMPGRAFCMSALRATSPERKPSADEGSIDMLYERAIRKQPYMRRDAVSELDKLAFMLLSDEFSALMKAKAESLVRERNIKPRPTRLDKLVKLWAQIFPGSRILRQAGTISFENEAGDNPVSSMKLSQGEKAVFYHIAAVLYAMNGAVIFVDDPTLFMHPSIYITLWNAIEELRPDCTFVYSTVDPDFVNSRTDNLCIWVKAYDADMHAWDYNVLNNSDITDDIFIDIIGSHRPVLFIEGDGVHSIDSKLYSIVFNDYTVRPLGSCNKVIETTRSFNDMQRMHHIDSHGIVDRDRRTDAEVAYLRRKNIFVPNVAEVENIFMLEEVIHIMARRQGVDGRKVFAEVKRRVIEMFRHHADAQALQHVRHRVKRDVETKIDARFTCITALETHLKSLVDKLQPRRNYTELHNRFFTMIDRGDYEGILRVFNYKPMLPESQVAQLLGFRDKEEYISGVLDTLKGMSDEGMELRRAIKRCFGLDIDDSLLPEALEREADMPPVEGFPYAPARQRKKRKKGK